MGYVFAGVGGLRGTYKGWGYLFGGMGGVTDIWGGGSIREQGICL